MCKFGTCFFSGPKLAHLAVQVFVRAKICLDSCKRGLKALSNFSPSYISNLLENYKPTRSLRSSSRKLLVIPHSKLKSYGNHAFSVSAPKLWNDIPEIIKCRVDLNTFKCNQT